MQRFSKRRSIARAAPSSDGVYFPRFRELLHCLWSTIKAICSHLESPLYRRWRHYKHRWTKTNTHSRFAVVASPFPPLKSPVPLDPATIPSSPSPYHHPSNFAVVRRSSYTRRPFNDRSPNLLANRFFEESFRMEVVLARITRLDLLSFVNQWLRQFPPTNRSSAFHHVIPPLPSICVAIIELFSFIRDL